MTYLLNSKQRVLKQLKYNREGKREENREGEEGYKTNGMKLKMYIGERGTINHTLQYHVGYTSKHGAGGHLGYRNIVAL